MTYEEGDGTVKVGKEDILGIGVLEVRHDCECDLGIYGKDDTRRWWWCWFEREWDR